MGSTKHSLFGNRRARAALLMILSALSFSAMQLAIKLSNRGGEIPLAEQAFCRNLISLFYAYVLTKKSGLPLFGPRKAQPLLFARSATGLLAIFALFYATNHADIADATILNRLSPAVSTLLAVLFLHERASFVTCLSLGVSFLGAWVVCGPSFHSNPVALAVALLSAFLTGAAHALVAALKDKAEPTQVILHFSTFSVLCTGLMMIGHFVVPSLFQLFMLLLIGVFGSLGQITLTFSLKLAPASEVSIYNYTGIIWSALLGMMFLNEVPALHTLLGGALVTAASLISYLYGKEHSRKGSAIG